MTNNLRRIRLHTAGALVAAVLLAWAAAGMATALGSDHPSAVQLHLRDLSTWLGPHTETAGTTAVTLGTRN